MKKDRMDGRVTKGDGEEGGGGFRVQGRSEICLICFFMQADNNVQLEMYP